MTPCKKLGYKVGDRFKVTNEDNYKKWPVGNVVVLTEDDGSDCPYFHSEKNTEEACYISLEDVEKLTQHIKTGDTIERDGKKYRITIEEIPQYDFKPGMVCKVDWDLAEAGCVWHTTDTRVIYLENSMSGRERIAYADTDGSISLGYVNTSSLRPE